MANSQRRIGVVLFQLGGPDTLDAIQPFLLNLFSDPDIIDFPGARIGRKALAHLIAATRAKKVEHHYAAIGGGSPIRAFTEQQARALQDQLTAAGLEAHCVVAMRYWHPFTAEAIEQLDALRCDEIVLLPLYPHYSSTTTGSSLNEWRRLYRADVPVRCIDAFYRNELYLQAVVEKLQEALARFASPERVEIVFSAHSVPMAVIEKGDPYQQQIEETVELVMRRGGWTNHHTLAYQSKVGASKWLQPSLHYTLRDLASRDIRNICVVPISFVSDHVETLGELHHEARHEAQALGIEQFEVTAGLNTSPAFIAALTDLVLQSIRSSCEETQTQAPEIQLAAD